MDLCRRTAQYSLRVGLNLIKKGGERGKGYAEHAVGACYCSGIRIAAEMQQKSHRRPYQGVVDVPKAENLKPGLFGEGGGDEPDRTDTREARACISTSNKSCSR